MASLLSPTATTFHRQNHSFIWSLSIPRKKNLIKCSAFFSDISENLLNTSLSLEQSWLESPALQQLRSFTGELPETQRWGLLVFAGVSWIYLTARPGVLIGAVDAYLFAPLQLGLDTLIGRRSLKRRDFLVGEKLGEGSFGVVYSGVVVPKNVDVDETVRRKGIRRSSQLLDKRFKDKVILKKVKIGVKGAVECGDFEEWFNYRLSRAAPDTCADFLGSFIADKTTTQFTKGEKWLVWKYEGDLDLADYMPSRPPHRHSTSAIVEKMIWN